MPHQTSKTAGFAERREFGRRSTLWHAWIITPGRERLACTVRNVSLGGALLELEVPSWLPTSFEVAIDHPALIVHCDLRHRGVHGVGVAFAEPEKARDFYNLSGTRGVQTSAHVDAGQSRPKVPSVLVYSGVRRMI